MDSDARKAISGKISVLAHEGYTNPKQRVAIALSEYRKGGIARVKRVSGKKKKG